MSEDALNEAFPPVDPGVKPLGSRVLVQIRTPETKTKGGIILSHNDQDTQMWNTSVAKVISHGPLAYHNRNDGSPWPEGFWCVAGDYVRVPKYGGDRWVSENDKGQKAYFVVLNDLDIIAKVEQDPLAIKAFF